MAESTVIRTKRDGVIVISDNGGVNTYTVAYEPGNFNYSAPMHGILQPLDRGELVNPRRQDAQPVTGGFGVHLRDIGSGADITLPDICEWRGWWGSNAVSTLNNSSDLNTVDLAWTVDGSVAGESDKTATFAKTALRGGAQEGDPNAYNCTFQSSILKPTVA